MAIWWQNLTYAARRLRLSPGLALAAMLSIGLGVAANSTIFSMVNTFVLRPAPVGDPSSLLSLNTLPRGERCCNQFTWPQYLDVRDKARSFSGVAAYYELLPASIGGSDEPERVWGQAATGNYFDVIQRPMALGRGFLPSEEQGQVIVLGYSLWQRRFAADPAIVGRTVSLSGHRFTVIGVAPRGFRGVDQLLNPQFWVPLGNLEQPGASIPDRSSRVIYWLSVTARLQPGVSRAQAESELRTLAANLSTA